MPRSVSPLCLPFPVIHFLSAFQWLPFSNTNHAVTAAGPPCSHLLRKEFYLDQNSLNCLQFLLFYFSILAAPACQVLGLQFLQHSFKVWLWSYGKYAMPQIKLVFFSSLFFGGRNEPTHLEIRPIKGCVSSESCFQSCSAHQPWTRA